MPKPTTCKHCSAVNKHFSFQCRNKPKRKLSDEEKIEQKELNVFFASQVLVMPFSCENCSNPLRASTMALKRCVTAHILPKSKFKGIGTHPQNRMFLGVFCGCHNQWDNGDSESRKQMNCYSLALARFEEFSSKLTDKESVQANKYLGI